MVLSISPMDLMVSKVLRDHHELHDLRGGSVLNALLELVDRSLQSGNDGLALVGDALTLQALAGRFGLGLFDLQDFLGLAPAQLPRPARVAPR